MSFFEKALGIGAAPFTGGASLLPTFGGDKGRTLAESIPVLGPMATAIFGSPQEEALQKQIKAMQDAYTAYRPQVAQSRMNALGNQLSVYGPVNDMLGKMYGQGAQVDTSKLMQNPMANMFPPPPVGAAVPGGRA